MSITAEKYAKALFDSARDGNNIEVTQQAFSSLVDGLKKGDIPDIGSFPASFRSFLSVLSSRKGYGHIFEIFEKFSSMRDEESDTVRARIFTSSPLDDKKRSRIEDVLSRKLGVSVALTNAVDPSVIGGAVIRIGDRVLDYSVAAGLDALKKELVR